MAQSNQNVKCFSASRSRFLFDCTALRVTGCWHTHVYFHFFFRKPPRLIENFAFYYTQLVQFYQSHLAALEIYYPRNIILTWIWRMENKWIDGLEHWWFFALLGNTSTKNVPTAKPAGSYTSGGRGKMGENFCGVQINWVGSFLNLF